MEFIVLIMVLLLILLILAKTYDVKLKYLKEFAEKEEEKFNEIVKKYPSNIEVCKYILKMLHNNNVKVEEDKSTNTCLYIAITNKIIIADVKDSYTRIQTIAHECLHSIQDRKILLFNFIFSNIYLIFFAICMVLGIFKLIPNKMIFVCLMLIFSYIYYFVRSYLENDAMIKAKYLAKQYMLDTKIASDDEINSIIRKLRPNKHNRYKNYKL